MNEVIKAIIERRSVRRYKPEMPPRELIEQVVEAGTYAASGKGGQSAIIVAVTNREDRDQLARMNREIMGAASDTFYGAPVVLVVLARLDSPHRVYDGSLVMGNLMLAAHALGLGSCWIHRARQEFASEEGRALLQKWGIKGEYEGIGHCILGYPDGPAAKAHPRKADYVHYAE